MSGRVKNRVLGPVPGGIQAPGSRSPGPDWRVPRGLAARPLPPPAPPRDGRAAQTPPGPMGARAQVTRCAGEPAALHTLLAGAGSGGCTLAAPGLLGSERGVPAAAARLATETRGWEAASGVPRAADGEPGARAGKRFRVSAVLSEAPALEPVRPALTAPPDGLEEATGEGTAGGAVEVLKILAKSDPRSNTATFMSQSRKGGPRSCLNLQRAGIGTAGLHPLPRSGARPRLPWAEAGVLGSPHAAAPRGPLALCPREVPPGAQLRTALD